MSRFNLLSTLAAAILGTVLFIGLFNPMRFHIEALELEASMELFNPGVTQFRIPPVGTISAQTHRTPLKMTVTLRNIDMNLLRSLIEQSFEQGPLVENVEKEIRRILLVFIARLFLLGLAGGAAGVLLLHRKLPRDYIMGGLAGTAIVGLLVAGTYFTYNPKAFRDPTYDGIITAAPFVVSMAEQGAAYLASIQQKMQAVSSNLYRLYESLDRLQPVIKAGAFTILHVSDIHNNPAAYEFLNQISSSFDVDMIIDTGDITDFGSPLEAKLVQQLAGLEVPYVFVSGNHDSPAILSALQQMKHITVLDGEVRTVSGIRIAGIGDPSARSTTIVPPSDAVVDQYVKRMKTIIQQSPTPPFILAAHNPRLAISFAGQVPLILHGHDHVYSVTRQNNSVVLDAGTTGAAGLQMLGGPSEVPYSLALIYLNPDEFGWKLTAVDVIRVENLQSGFTVKRQNFEINLQPPQADR